MPTKALAHVEKSRENKREKTHSHRVYNKRKERPLTTSPTYKDGIPAM